MSIASVVVVVCMSIASVVVVVCISIASVVVVVVIGNIVMGSEFVAETENQKSLV